MSKENIKQLYNQEELEKVYARTRKNIRERALLYEKASKNRDLQLIEMELCKADPLHWFKRYAYTDRNPKLYGPEFPSVIPFLLYDFQIEALLEIIESVEESQKPTHLRNPEIFTEVFIEKTRQMGVSWLLEAINTRGFLFRGWKSLSLSMKAEDVDNGTIKSLLGKSRFMIKNCPQWMLPKGFSKKKGTPYNSHMKLTHPTSTASIMGETAKKDAGRGGTIDIGFMDEMAFMMYAKEILKAMKPSAGSMIYVSTPNGQGNEYYRIKLNTQDRRVGDKLIPASVKGIRLHWTEHPLYTQARYDQVTQGEEPETIAQEYDIEYNTALKGRVYNNFDPSLHKLEYNRRKQTYVVIDNSHGGNDPHACIVIQIDPKSHYVDVIDCFDIKCQIDEMANIMAKACRTKLNDVELAFYKRYSEYDLRNVVYVSDPYDTKSKITNIHNPEGVVIYDEYQKTGITLNVPPIKSLLSRIELTKKNIKRVRCGENTSPFMSAISNAMYPKEGNRTTPANVPIHDWTSHYRTCIEYFFAYVEHHNPELLTEPKKKKLIEYKDAFGNIVQKYI